jgi:hypothetical protein
MKREVESSETLAANEDAEEIVTSTPTHTSSESGAYLSLG